ncbi:MAG: hypothetical protein H6Q04_1451 [Acidobacteria bacterium]|jgi:hypothetical protein|nr:hypothetical protein [Acidobacteriota bacterium]
MWKIINADSEYNRIINNIGLIVILCVVVINAIVAGIEEPLSIIMLLSFMFLGINAGLDAAKSKRIRLLAGLPVPIKTIGLHRQYGVAKGWSIWVILLFLSSLINRHGHLEMYYVWRSLTLIGTMFILVGLINLASDLYFSVQNKKPQKKMMAWIVGPILWLAAFCCGPSLYLIAASSEPGNIWDLFLFSPAAIGYLLFGIAALALDVYIFTRRRSYLEEYPQ